MRVRLIPLVVISGFDERAGQSHTAASCADTATAPSTRVARLLILVLPMSAF